MMTPKIMSHAATVSSKSNYIKNTGRSTADFATIARAPLRFTVNRRITSRDLQIVEAANELLEVEVPEPEGVASNVSLLRGFNATIPSAEKGKSRRRQTRNVETPALGLRKLGLNARGLLASDEHEAHSVVSEDDIVLVNETTPKAKRKPRQSLATTKTLGREELKRQRSEIQRDRENVQVKRVRSFVLLWRTDDQLTPADPGEQRDCGNHGEDRSARRHPCKIGAGLTQAPGRRTRVGR